MDVFEAIKKRRSVRKFQKKLISEKIIGRLIEALIWAPSVGNLQSRKFYFVFDDKIKKKLVEEASSPPPRVSKDEAIKEIK